MNVEPTLPLLSSTATRLGESGCIWKFLAGNPGEPNTTLLASMSAEGMGAHLAVEGATTKVLLETYVERVLAPSLRFRQVVMDNLSEPIKARRSGN